MNKNKVFVCNFCGSESVCLSATATWNKETQEFRFEINDLYNASDMSNGYCRDCDNWANIVEEKR